MNRKLVYALLVAMLFSLIAVPGMAQTVCTGIVYFQPDGGSDLPPNNGTKDAPFQTQAKAFEILRALNGNCAIELDEVGEQVQIHIRALPPETGVSTVDHTTDRSTQNALQNLETNLPLLIAVKASEVRL